MGEWTVNSGARFLGDDERTNRFELVRSENRTAFTLPRVPPAVASAVVKRILPGLRWPWLTFDRATLVRPCITAVACDRRYERDGRGGWVEVCDLRFETASGVLTTYLDDAHWSNNPDLNALSAAHFAAVLRGDSLLLIIADWFADRGVDDMERVCRDLAAKGGA